MTIAIERIRCEISVEQKKKLHFLCIPFDVEKIELQSVLTMYEVTSNNQKIRASRMKLNYRTTICVHPTKRQKQKITGSINIRHESKRRANNKITKGNTCDGCVCVQWALCVEIVIIVVMPTAHKTLFTHLHLNFATLFAHH